MTEPEGARLGPRPLPLHLMAAALTWTGSRAALPLLRSGSLPWRPELSEAGAALEASLERHDPEAFQGAVEDQLNRRMTALADGILGYRRHPYRRDLPEPPVLWRDGTTRLLDYGASAAHAAGVPAARAAPPVLVVPSLINRGYILDLSADRSLLRWLAGRGLRPLLVDWDRPGPEERGFTLTDYIAGRLEGALDAVLAEVGARPTVIGYCMGGLLALALALRRGDDLAGLALLATPWDFHADDTGTQGALAAAALPGLAPSIEARGELPVDIIQGLFASLDPQLVLRKFLAFARLDPASPKAATFVALEDWLNDGVALSAPVARECLGGWYGDNTPARGAWRVAGEIVEPGRLGVSSLCMIPAQDRIVPPASAQALAKALPATEIITPRLGHIGMMVSAGAETQYRHDGERGRRNPGLAAARGMAHGAGGGGRGVENFTHRQARLLREPGREDYI
jgi:polyhydroxyalkanoate synthase